MAKSEKIEQQSANVSQKKDLRQGKNGSNAIAEW